MQVALFFLAIVCFFLQFHIYVSVINLHQLKVNFPALSKVLGIRSFGESKTLTMLSYSLTPSWEELSEKLLQSPTCSDMQQQIILQRNGSGKPHTDAPVRLFGTQDEPRVIYYRDSAAWCPYCQKVWILLEEKRIPYKVQKINMRSYGDKPSEFLRKVPNGLLPAIELDRNLRTDSLSIMLELEQTFRGPDHPKMWPAEEDPDLPRAVQLMRLERDLFSRWCGAVFRPSLGGSSIRQLEDGLDAVDKELSVVEGPWFLSYLSIVDLTYISHVERMCASLAYWSGLKIRGDGRWPALERWMDGFEELPSYMATKSDYYTHVMDIPPQYGPSFPVSGWEVMARQIDGKQGGWRLPLPAFSPTDLEPVSPKIDPGEEGARLEAAFKLSRNHEAVTRFALRGAGQRGAKQFQAPLADPYAVPNLDYFPQVDTCLRWVAWALLEGYTSIPPLLIKTPILPDTAAAGGTDASNADGSLVVDTAGAKKLELSLAYLRDRVGVPRDMSYPAARQLRAHLNWAIDCLKA